MTETAGMFSDRVTASRIVTHPEYLPLELLGRYPSKSISSSSSIVAAVYPLSSAGAYTMMGLMTEPGCRRIRVARL